VMQENPAWVNRVLNAHWEAIEARIGRQAMPLTKVVGKRKKKLEHDPELGCGHYGCVLRSVSAGKVFKLTSDTTEAAFVAAALSLPQADWPAGMIRYWDLFEIPGEKHRGRKVYGLVRDVATRVGIRLSMVPSQQEAKRAAPEAWVKRYHEHSIAEGVRWLMLFRECAHRVKLYVARQPAAKVEQTIVNIAALDDWARYMQGRTDDWPEVKRTSSWGGSTFEFQSAVKWRGAEAAAIDLRRCRHAAEIMASGIHFVASIGSALDYYLDQGMLLADVHLNNIGEAEVEWSVGDRGLDMVITDPGHMVPLTTNWLSVNVPQL
jgi:hypothetical protein